MESAQAPHLGTDSSPSISFPTDYSREQYKFYARATDCFVRALARHNPIREYVLSLFIPFNYVRAAHNDLPGARNAVWQPAKPYWPGNYPPSAPVGLFNARRRDISPG